MPRANRYRVPGLCWHITHRCHKQDFLLKFERDRLAWRYWLYEARRRYGLCVFNYMVTSNHIHVLVEDQGRDEVPASMRLIAGRTAQAYNQRKGRNGAFWEDRYHATAVEGGEHLGRCLVYIDLNMVRAGVVQHPADWRVCGYHDIQFPRQRYRILERAALADALGLDGIETLADYHAEWLATALRGEGSVRDRRWSDSLAVGSESFVRRIHRRLGARATDRQVRVEEGMAHLAEERARYGAISRPKWSV